MNSRRKFLERVGQGTAFSAIAFFSPLAAEAQRVIGTAQRSTIDAQGLSSTASLKSAKVESASRSINPDINQKTLTIGIIGAENSHTWQFGKLFNIDKAFPGMEVKYVWGETLAFAETAMEKGGIPNRVDDPREMLGKIDGLIVDHRHGKFHLEPAAPFIEAGIPTFIDKPFCYRLEEGKAFMKLAEKHNTPVTSYSSIAHSRDTLAMKEQLKTMGKIDQVVRYGPVELDSEYGGVFFYGPHIVEPLLYLFGENVEKVQVQKNGKNSSASMVFNDGMLATLVFTTKKYGWQTFVETDDGILELKAESEMDASSENEENSPSKADADMVEMFRTGKEPRSHRSILYTVAVLEALEKSVNSGNWEVVEMGS